MPEPEPMKPIQLFEVVMLKNGVSDLTAAVEDFKRVKVTATSPMEAMLSKEVAAEKGHRALFAAPQGVMTEPEIMARRRAMEGAPVDKSKI